MNIQKLFAFFLAFVPVSAFADRLHYKDNKGLLYCQAICTVDGTQFKTGIYPTNSEGKSMTVRGKWLSKFLITTDGWYQVKKEILNSAQKVCNNHRAQLFEKDPIKGLFENRELSGVNEKLCKILPRITSGVGAMAFEMVEEPEEKTDL